MLKAEHAYYLKLGRGGKWADDSIHRGWARIGWRSTPLAQIHAGQWAAIKQALRPESKTAGAATMDANALERFCRSTEEDIWITFHDSKLWWGRLKNGPVQEDATSKYRELVDRWHDHSIKGAPLLANQVSGRLSQLQGFRATICRVRERDVLLRVLNGEQSPDFVALADAKDALAASVARAVKNLHWKDFELLVDLVFRQSGWRRVSVVGETMKSVDLELEDPITSERYQVQVKSRATKETMLACREDLHASAGSAFRKSYFVVHTPDPDLLGSGDADGKRFQVILPDRLAHMIIDGGLTKWLMDKIA